MLGFRRKPRWGVVAHPGPATRPVRIHLTKRDRLDLELPTGTATVTLVDNPSRRLQEIGAGGRLEISRDGVLLSSLPIRRVRYNIRTRELVITSQRREEGQF